MIIKLIIYLLLLIICVKKIVILYTIYEIVLLNSYIKLISFIFSNI